MFSLFTTEWNTWWWSIPCLRGLVAAGIPREKVTYIPNFVNKEKWHPLPVDKVSQLRQGMGIDKEEFVVVGAGQVQKRKGIDDLSVWLRNCLRLPLSGLVVSLLVV